MMRRPFNSRNRARSELNSRLIFGIQSTNWRSIGFGVLLCLFAVQIQPSFAQSPSDVFQSIIQKTQSSQALWATSVRDVKGETLAGVNEDSWITPASNLKLLSSAALLHVLGVEYTFNTKLYGIGRQQDDVWKGDLIFVGKGDPSIGAEFYENQHWYVFDSFLKQLRQKGIFTIEGSIIVNTGWFDDIPYPEHWSWDDLSFYYGVELGALSFNRNTVELTVRAGEEVGSTPEISWFPFNTDYVRFINEQKVTSPTSSYEEYYRRYLSTNTILLRSTMPPNYVEEEALSISNPGLFFADTFQKYTERNGITWMNPSIKIDTDFPDAGKYNSAQLLAEHTSYPLSVLMHQVNKKSDNFYIEMILKSAAAEKMGRAGTTLGGVHLVKKYLHSIGVDTTQTVIKDGSGLAASTLLSPSAFTQFLTEVRKESFFADWKESLPVSGKEGSLRYRFLNTPLEGNIQAKTGYISGARVLSGYLVTKSGKSVSFSVATNHFIENVSAIDAAHQEWLLYVYNHF